MPIVASGLGQLEAEIKSAVADLLSQALYPVHSTPSTQASLRRSVSSAYDAVFHLPVLDAVAAIYVAPSMALRQTSGRRPPGWTLVPLPVRCQNLGRREGGTGSFPHARD